jgi:protein-L-isoaspartate(D-aspartate) O-methyltransferase
VEIARTNLAKYRDIENIEIFFKDASLGIPEHAPYDAIHVAVSYGEIPEVLRGQLKIGGRLVAPTSNNDLRLIERSSEKEFRETIHKGYFFDTIKSGVE